MSLKTQIISLLFSLFYGIFFGFLITLNYKYIYNKKMLLKTLTTFFFIIVNVFLYFIILIHINNGIIHIYLLFMILFGYIIEFNIHRYIERKKKK